jgi:hypothetical protein
LEHLIYRFAPTIRYFRVEAGPAEPLVREPQVKRHRRAWRLARAGWGLAKRDSALALLALLLVGSIGLMIVAMTAAASHLSHGLHAVSFYFLLSLGAGFGVTFLTAFFGAAMAHAASAGFDGLPLTVREAIAEARESIGQLLVWAAIVTGLMTVVVLVTWTGTGGVLAANLGLAVWSFLVAFAVPLIALDAAGAGEAIGESAALAKRRWGEELVGGFAIVVLWALAFFICAVVYVPAVHAFSHHHNPGSAAVMVVAGLAAVLTVIYAVATAQAFVVALLRFDRGESTLEQLKDPPAPVYSRPAGLRMAGLALSTAAVVGVIALVGFAGIAERSEQYYTSIPTTSAAGIEAGTPVVYEEEEVGQVLSTEYEGSSIRVSFEVKRRVASEASGEPIRVDTFDGRPCLEIGPASSSGAPSTGAA